MRQPGIDMLEDLTDTLMAITTPGSFATRRTSSPDDLCLDIRGVGAIEWPVAASTAHRLRGIARRARFGRRDMTMMDENVRDTWEIAKSRVKIDKRKWNKTLRPQLELIREDLGLPASGKLDARLYKLLLYEPGQFFVPHQDSEKSSDMVGTLTIVLPSEYKGGSVSIKHRGETVTYRPLQNRSRVLTFVAFYSDCHHEVRPVAEGFRVVLVYDLIFDGAPSAAREPLDAQVLDELVQHVDDHFETPTSEPYSNRPSEPPDKLVYLLDHEYTQQSLGWTRLKNGDRLRAAALRAVAERLDCEIFLALADVHELWSYEGDDPYDGWGYGGRWDDPHDEDGDPDSYALVSLDDTDIELRHWLDASGKAIQSVVSNVSWNEFCYTRPSVEFDPFHSEHEGYMGNYGNTVDRWYHRAALVLWPRSRTFVIRAKLSPMWAIGQLENHLEGSADEGEVEDRVRALLPFWSAHALREDSSQFLQKTLQVATKITDSELAASLLEPFHLGQLDRSATPHVLALLESRGLAWCRDLLSKWAERIDGRYVDDRESQWLAFMPILCEKLHSDGAAPGKELTRWLVEHQWSRLRAECQEHLEDAAHPYAVEQLSSLSRRLAYVLTSCIAIDEDELSESISTYLVSPDTRYPVLCLIPLLRESRKLLATGLLGSPGPKVLREHCIAELRGRLAAPERRVDDWSISPPQQCACDLCVTLGEFLSHGDHIRFEWPIAKDKRRHVHNQLDRYELPVSHTTRRKGSPYTLVLEKTKALFAREAELRRIYERELKWLLQE